MTGLLRHASHLSWGIVDIVRRLAVSVFAGGVERLAGEDLAGLWVGGDGLVARVLAALRSGRGLIVAGRAGPPPCIHDAATAANPIVVNHAPEHLSAMPRTCVNHPLELDTPKSLVLTAFLIGNNHTYWGDFHSLKNKDAMEYECFQMLTMGTGCSIGDQLHPRGGLSDATYDLIGRVYSQVEALEPYTLDTDTMADMAVMTPEREWNMDSALSDSLIGANRMLTELGCQFDIIDPDMDFTRYGDVVYFSHPLFRIYKDFAPSWVKAVFADVLDLLMPRQLVRKDDGHTVSGLEVQLRRSGSRNSLMLHCLYYPCKKSAANLYTIDEKVPLFDQRVRVYAGDAEIESVRAVRQGEVISERDYTVADGYVELNIPKIDGYEIIELSLK
ncbi:hypothetical protein [Bifidobacterium longum]|uniref:hypothetical protein n=1 Tax=Bifidobacterium longum TaxID=216816 RepID=UPI0020242801|nr:hypothetical protein [Bifidobacterium longum]